MARKSARVLWADHLKGKPQTPKWENAAPRAPPEPFRGMVLGIDPSLRGTGLAVLRFLPRAPGELIASRTLKLKPNLAMATCLGEIFNAVEEIIANYPLDHVALEQPIYVQNTRTALILGAARGAAIAAAAKSGLPIFEYAPLRIKQAVVGFGRASKHQVARTVKGLLGLSEIPKPDEADAAGAALCHAFTWRPDRTL